VAPISKVAFRGCCSIAVLGLLAAAPPSGCAKQQGTGGPVHGSVYYLAPVKKAAPGENDPHIFLPDIELYLHNAATGVDSAPVKTDLFGRYYFPHQSPGRYELHWKAQGGWSQGNHPDPISITSGPRFPVPARIRPADTGAVIFGRVTLDDGSTPWSYDELFLVNHTATVTILNVARTATLGGPVRANVLGRYAVAGLPRSQETTIRAQSQAASVTRVLSAAALTMGNSIDSTDVELPNKRPEIISVVPQTGGALIATAAPGATISLSAASRDLNGDPLQHEWATLNGHGSIAPAEASSANWTLPAGAGRYSAYLQVADGRGGYARQRIDFTTARTTTIFSGVAVEKVTGTPVKAADVSVNGTTSATDSNGFFQVAVPLKDRYVLNIAREGFATFGRVVDSGLTGQTWPLVKVQPKNVDPSQPIDLVDTRPELERKKQRGARIRIPADSLVGPNGLAATGPLKAYFATLLVDEGEAPGDWGAMLGGSETNLISFGAAFVEFRDGAGAKYQLGSGKTAEVEMFPPTSMISGAPPTAKFWSYDEKDGYWKKSGSPVFSATTKSFLGKVDHFSTINTDLEKNDAACLKILIYPPIPTGVKLRITDPSGAVFSQSFEFVLDAGINAAYRLPASTDVQLDLFNDNGTPYNAPVLLEETPGTPLPGNVVNTGPPIPSGQSLWPPEPYETCKLVILREANEPTATAFFAFKGAGTAAQAQGYYAFIDPDENGDGVGERTTLGAWWSKNGFTFDANGNPTNGVRTSYLNFNDLGSGRDMHFLQHADGTAAAYVTNYGLFNQDHGNADLALSRTNPGATVCMEYGPVAGQGSTRIVKFFVFAGGDFSFNAPRVESADLDGFGQKFVPNLCENCHGGTQYSPANPASPTFAEVNLGASFRELDIATYKFPGGRLTANDAEKTAFREQNLIVKGLNANDTIAIQPIKDLIAGWYPGASIEQDNTFTPPGWVGAPQQGLYHDVVKQSCRTCHVALDADPSDGGIGWITYEQLRQRREFGILDYIALCDARVMPHAVTTYRNFWLSASPHRPAVLRDFSNGAGWTPLGVCQ